MCQTGSFLNRARFLQFPSTHLHLSNLNWLYTVNKHLSKLPQKLNPRTCDLYNKLWLFSHAEELNISGNWQLKLMQNLIFMFLIVFCLQFYVIWSWLPARSAVCQPKLLYTSEEHGVSLRTLYVMTEEYEPTIIVIKTLTDEVIVSKVCAWRNGITNTWPVD